MTSSNVQKNPSILEIVKLKRFTGLFQTQFLTSFNDNFFKNAIIALLNFGSISEGLTPFERQLWIIYTGLCFIVPYFLFSATAGKLAEKYDRIRLVYFLKYSEIIILALGGIGFIIGSIPLMLAMLFLMGAQSTFFSPIKFGILPTYLHRNALVGGNALIETATFISIILGTIIGTQLVLVTPYGEVYSFCVMVIIAILGVLTAYKMPSVSRQEPNMKINFNVISHNIEIFKIMFHSPRIFKYILLGGWFWFVTAVIMMALPNYVSDVLQLDKNMYTVLLVLFSIGVGSGSILCSVLLKGNISAKYTPYAALIMTLFSIDIGYISAPLIQVTSFYTFFTDPTALRIMFDFLVLSMAGGGYIVPFFALVQDQSKSNETSRMIAGNNIINAAAMVLGGLYILYMTYLEFPLQSIFLMTGGFCLLGAISVFYLVKSEKKK